jgi:HSP20 family molecular chaperone IbpA
MKQARKDSGNPGDEDADAGLGEFLGALRSALSDVIGQLGQGEAGEVHRDIQLQTDRGPLRAQAGIRVRLGGASMMRHANAGGRDAVRPAPAPQTAAPEVPARPIAADVVNDGKVWLLTADLPGVAREDLSIAVEEGMLIISASGRGRRYVDRIAVPAGTGADDLRISLQNGILEIEAPAEKAGSA